MPLNNINPPIIYFIVQWLPNQRGTFFFFFLIFDKPEQFGSQYLVNSYQNTSNLLTTETMGRFVNENLVLVKYLLYLWSQLLQWLEW